MRGKMSVTAFLVLWCWTLLVSSAPTLISNSTDDQGTESGFGVGPLSEDATEALLQSPGNYTLNTTPVEVLSRVPVGVVIRKCTVPGAFALTFDDGPYKYTGQVLDMLKKAGMPATFFVNGKNWGDIESPEGTALIKRTIAEGHQVASHTWSHANLTKVNDRAGTIAEMNRLDAALYKIIGKTPTYMRPPFYETGGQTLPVMRELGFHVVQSDIDTWDWAWNSQAQIHLSVNKFHKELNAGGTLELSHDVGEWTVKVLVPAMIKTVQERGLKAMTVGDCLGDPPANWYRKPRSVLTTVLGLPETS